MAFVSLSDVLALSLCRLLPLRVGRESRGPRNLQLHRNRNSEIVMLILCFMYHFIIVIINETEYEKMTICLEHQ